MVLGLGSGLRVCVGVLFCSLVFKYWFGYCYTRWFWHSIVYICVVLGLVCGTWYLVFGSGVGICLGSWYGYLVNGLGRGFGIGI